MNDTVEIVLGALVLSGFFIGGTGYIWADADIEEHDPDCPITKREIEDNPNQCHKVYYKYNCWYYVKCEAYYWDD